MGMGMGNEEWGMRNGNGKGNEDWGMENRDW